MIKIKGYPHLNFSIFPYTPLYTSQKRFRKCMIEKIAFYNLKKKCNISPTLTKGYVHSVKTIQSSFNKCVLKVFFCCIRKWQKNVSAWCDLSLLLKLTGNAGKYPFCCARTKTEVFFTNIQKLSLTLLKNISQHWNASTFYKGTLSLSLSNKSVLVIKPLAQA